jgi:acetyltransferase-like isoleucine patch superfamily enzyme
MPVKATVAATAVVPDWVQLAEGHFVDDFVILGRRMDPLSTTDPLPLVIGPGARIRSHTVIYEGNRIGAGFQSGHGVLVREQNEIGDDVSIGSHSVIEHHVTVGRGVRIHSNCFIPEYCVLEEESWIGPCVVMTNARYPKSPGAKHNLRGVIVERGAKIGAGAVLLPGVRIGAGALVGSGCVVTRDVPPLMVVAGNPARTIKNIQDIPDYQQPPS